MVHGGSATEIILLHTALKDSKLLGDEIALILNSKDMKAQLNHFAKVIHHAGLSK